MQGRSDKMTTRLTMMNQRYQDLERRRNLEVEGFKNDIKNLRSRLKDVERQLYKVSTSCAQVKWRHLFSFCIELKFHKIKYKSIYKCFTKMYNV